LLAFVGGLILNLMPCVFPVLSLKALSLAAPGHDDRRLLRLQGVAFAAGVVLTFVALAGALLAFRAAGEQLGWGFQLQSPAVVTALAVLFFVLALNLSGVFEFTSLVPSSALRAVVRRWRY
jgi:thiol:disulfide interchange protein DsbD